MSGVVSVREFSLEDLEAIGQFCDAARVLDASVEPFSQRLGLIATGTRALLPLWRVAVDEKSAVCGVAFAAVRTEDVLDFYAAVHPAMRRQGLARALAEPSLAAGMRLRARVRDDAGPGRAFLVALGFVEAGAQLSLHWSGREPYQPPMPALRIRPGVEKDRPALQRLSAAAWTDAPDTRADEISQLFDDQDRVLLLAESDGRPLGYLSALHLGRTLGIEEVAVLPDHRRMGIGRALVAQALARAPSAVLSVSESNHAARALYRSLGFTQAARRLLFERPP